MGGEGEGEREGGREGGRDGGRGRGRERGREGGREGESDKDTAIVKSHRYYCYDAYTCTCIIHGLMHYANSGPTQHQ